MGIEYPYTKEETWRHISTFQAIRHSGWAILHYIAMNGPSIAARIAEDLRLRPQLVSKFVIRQRDIGILHILNEEDYHNRLLAISPRAEAIITEAFMGIFEPRGRKLPLPARALPEPNPEMTDRALDCFSHMVRASIFQALVFNQHDAPITPRKLAVISHISREAVGLHIRDLANHGVLVRRKKEYVANLDHHAVLQFVLTNTIYFQAAPRA